MFLRFAYAYLFSIFFPLLILMVLYRLYFYRVAHYSFPMSSLLQQTALLKKTYHKKILFLIRFASLLGLILLIARPQFVDERSQINVEGVGMVLAIDVSDSMQLFDDLRDRRSRIEVAKGEAVRFIEKRTNDPIGIVLFGQEAVSRCPLTLDKKFLKELVGSIHLGMINPSATALGTGLATAVNRLKNDQAKSKVIILLTDGEPTPGEKIDPEVAMQLAKEFNIKVYTIGIANEEGGFINHPFGGVQRVGVKLNVALLKKIAENTGGKFFKASNPSEMRQIYDIIDQLEKTEYQTNLFHNYYEAFLSFIWIIILLFSFELVLRLFIWRGV
jgi:Ca-activated chloride channel homolog